MSKMIVSVFDDEQTAYKGTQALTELHREGSISVYSAAVVSRDADGAIRIKDAGDEGPLGTALGMLTGAIIGVLGMFAAMIPILTLTFCDSLAFCTDTGVRTLFEGGYVVDSYALVLKAVFIFAGFIVLMLSTQPSRPPRLRCPMLSAPTAMRPAIAGGWRAGPPPASDWVSSVG
mgnify:CR=1 FL=1